VPYRHRPIQPTYGEGSQWYNWMTEDQRFVTDRKDLAVWKLPVLKKDLVLTGEVSPTSSPPPPAPTTTSSSS
jgi:hypothetical protein